MTRLNNRQLAKLTTDQRRRFIVACHHGKYLRGESERYLRNKGIEL